MTERNAIVLGRHWLDRDTELAFVTRSIAGAASRCGPVSVLVPGPSGRREPDGAFDLEAIGTRRGAPMARRASRPTEVVVVDDLTPELAALLSRVDTRRCSTSRRRSASPIRHGAAVPLVDARRARSACYVPINPLAELHRHHGFGFTGYQLVLSDRFWCPPGAATRRRLAQLSLPRRRRGRRRGRRRVGLEGSGAAGDGARSTPEWTSGDWSRTPTSASTSLRDATLPANASRPSASARRSSCPSTRGRRRCTRERGAARRSATRASCSRPPGRCGSRPTGPRPPPQDGTTPMPDSAIRWRSLHA